MGICVGYSDNSRGYRDYFPNKNIVWVKKDIVFIIEKKQPESHQNAPVLFKQNGKTEIVEQQEAETLNAFTTNLGHINKQWMEEIKKTG